MSEQKLRQLVRLIIESESDDRDDDDLLLEPDRLKGAEAEEGSGAGAAGGGPAMPLGAGPSYPGPEHRSAKTARSETAKAVGRAFGGASPSKK